jgi:beta-glucosidase
VNPSGKLPITYPPGPNALLAYDHKVYEGTDTSFGLKAFRPQFEFASGLSYTTFAYADLRVSKPAAGGVDVTVRVTNTGARAGKESVQLYVGDQVGSLTPPQKRLKRFAKVLLEPGESRELRFNLRRDDFAVIGRAGKKSVEPGEFNISVGNLVQMLTLPELATATKH